MRTLFMLIVSLSFFGASILFFSSLIDYMMENDENKYVVAVDIDNEEILDIEITYKKGELLKEGIDMIYITTENGKHIINKNNTKVEFVSADSSRLQVEDKASNLPLNVKRTSKYATIYLTEDNMEYVNDVYNVEDEGQEDSIEIVTN